MHSQRMIRSTLRMMGRHRPPCRQHDTIMTCKLMAPLTGSSVPTQRQRRFVHSEPIDTIIDELNTKYKCSVTYLETSASQDIDADGEASIPQKSLVSLPKRCDELGICTHKAANKFLNEANEYNTRDDTEDNLDAFAAMKKKVIYVRGQPMINGPNLDVPSDETDIEIHDGMPIRLSKRCSELGICSKREAAAILAVSGEFKDVSSLESLEEVIYLRGKPVMGGAATKIPPGEKFIEIRAGNDPPDIENEGLKYVPYASRPWDEIQGDTIVLNKPIGYVSGQEEHQHVPAVRLLTRDNMYLDGFDFDEETQQTFKKGSSLGFDRWKYDGYDMKANSVPKKIRETLDADKLKEKNKGRANETLSGYAPAGRLDIDSTGVLLFTRAGIMARRLIEPKSKISKEYIVKVKSVERPTAREIEMGLRRLPRPTNDLSILLRRGNRLFDERNPLKPLLVAEWLDEEQTEEEWQQKISTMRLVLVEGKKRQIRRMCRELLGWHVVDLVRTSVGPVKIDSLPEGKWRPLTKEELKAIFEEQSDYSKKPKASDDELDIASSIVESGNFDFPNETKVVQAIRKALRKERNGMLGLPTLRKRVEGYLDFEAQGSAQRKRWVRCLQEIIDSDERLAIQGKKVMVKRNAPVVEGDQKKEKQAIYGSVKTW